MLFELMALLSLSRRLCRPAGFMTGIRRMCHDSSETAIAETEKKYELVTVGQAVALTPEKQRLIVRVRSGDLFFH